MAFSARLQPFTIHGLFLAKLPMKGDDYLNKLVFKVLPCPAFYLDTVIIYTANFFNKLNQHNSTVQIAWANLPVLSSSLPWQDYCEY